MSEPIYQCPVCKLHYHDKKWVAQCETFCTTHNACSLEIMEHSIERERGSSEG